jgi:hypothetical protein
MADFETELAIGIGTLTGGIIDITVKEREGKDEKSPLKDSLIIRKDRAWQVGVNWALKGGMLDLHWLDIRGKWVVKAYLEGFGMNAQETDHKGDTVNGILVEPPMLLTKDTKTQQTEWQYSETFTFSPNSVKIGAYKLVVSVTYEHDPGQPGPMAGFIEFPKMIQIYDPGD